MANAKTRRFSTTRKKQGKMKPKILLVADVRGWAWDIKSKQIVKFLSDEFDFHIHYMVQEGKLEKDLATKFDLFLTFAPKYVDTLVARGIPIERRITGVTAHFKDMEKDLQTRMGKVKYVHANSKMLLKIVEKYYPDSFYTPNGVDIELFYPVKGKKREVFTIGHVAKPSPRKGFKKIIEPAWIDAKKNGHIGLKVNQRRYHDAIPHHKMNEWYQDVDLMVFCSDIDGTPCPMLEAAACGIPSMINRIGNAPEFIRDSINGYLMEVGVTNYAEKLMFVRDHRYLCEYMGALARETILTDWTWQKNAENFRHMFRKVLNARS